MYIPKGTLETGKPGKFSKIEIYHILIAMSVLTIAFSFTISRNNILLFGFNNLENFPYSLMFSFLGVFTAFFVHEISHKFMAQKYGLWSEFRMYPQGLLFSLLLAIFTGFVIAAPGAVMFRGESRTFETGRIAAAGSLANIIIGGICLVLYHRVFIETDYGIIFAFICLVNVLLATFNLLPIRSLDGMKVIMWNGIVWSIMFGTSIIILVFLIQGGIPKI
jgi:Zn-dependent protease